MIQTQQTHRLVAWALVFLMGVPLGGLTGCGNNGSGPSGSTGATAPSAQPAAPPAPPSSPMQTSTPPPSATKPGMSTGTKVVIAVAGAALLYYLYKKHQAAQQAQGGGQAAGQQPQLYRSSNGGVYYRDPQNPQKVTWLTVPNQPMQVPASDLQRYAPDYQQYQGQPAPAAPAGQPQQSFTQYDPSLARS